MINNAVFLKNMENLRKNRDINLSQQKKRRNYLASEPSYNTTRYFTKNLLAIQMKKDTYE